MESEKISGSPIVRFAFFYWAKSLVCTRQVAIDEALFIYEKFILF